jgi:uncharacterized protein involved in outer membrane biogenesis
MKKAAIILLSLVVLVAIVAGGGLWWVNSYIQKPAFIEKIQRALSESAGARVAFGPFSLNPFTGVDVTEATMARLEPADAPPFFRVEQLDVRYLPWSLLHQTVELRRIELVRPILTLRQFPDGTWNLPDFRRSGDSSEITIRSGGQQYRVLLSDFNLTGGAVTALDAEGGLIFGIEDARVQGKLDVRATGAEANGTLLISALRLGSAFTFTDVASTLAYSNGQLSLPDLTGQSHGGTTRGAITTSFGTGGPSFTIRMKLADADLSLLLRDFGGGTDAGRIAGGKLNVETDLAGSLQRPRLLSGTGTMSIREGELTGLTFLQTLGDYLKIPELSDTRFDAIKGEFKIGDQKITFYNLEAVSKSVQFTSTGSLSFDKELDFDVLLALSPEVAARIPEQLRTPFSVRSDGYHTITFHLYGTLNSPKTNLPQKLLLQPAMEEFVNPLLDKLLKRDPQPPEPAPAAP